MDGTPPETDETGGEGGCAHAPPTFPGAFRALFETMAQGVVYQDASGRIILANPAAEEILGLSRDQLLGRTSLDPRWQCVREDGTELSGPEHPSMVALRTGEPVRDVVMGIYHPGEDRHRWMIVSATPEFDPGQPRPSRVYASFTDITERRNAEAALRESEARFHSLFQTMQEGFALHEVLCDDQGKVVDYRYLDINPAFERLTGLRRETTVGRTVRELIPGIEEEWIEAFGRVALTGEPLERESHVRDLDRTYRARAYSPRRGTFAVVFEDVTVQRRAQKEIEEREARLRVLFEASRAGIFLVDAEGRITMANRRMAELFGCPLAELIGTAYADHVHPEERGAGEERMRALLRGDVDFVGTERHYLRKDGGDFWGFLSGRRHEDAEGRLISLVGHVIDITESKRAEGELSRTKDHLEAMIDALPDLLFLVDREGLILEFRSSVPELLYLPPDRFLGKRVAEVLPEEAAGVILAALAEAAASGTHRGATYSLPMPQGIRWYELSIASLGGRQQPADRFVMVARDITARKKAEDDLRVSEENYRWISGLTSDFVYRCTRRGDAPFRIQWIGGAASSISGYRPEEILAKGCWLPLVHPDDRPAVADHLMSLRPGDRKNIELRLLAQSGDVRWISETSICLAGQSDDELVLFGAATDVTERRRADEERRRLEQQLLHAQKLESLGVLAGGIAHDFNNILATVVGNADMALLKLGPESPVLENLRRIETAAARAADLARQMLAYSGKGTFVIAPIDLDRLVEEMGHMLEVSISKKAILRYNLARRLPAVQADATQIRQIVMNLVINASEAIGDRSGVISITTGCIDCSAEYLREAWLTEHAAPGLYVFLEVADTGCGMDQETQSRIFDPFFTTKFTGRGLGMAAVMGIIRGHRGAIKVYSEPGRGSSFKILLPASDRPSELFREADPADAWRGSGTALLVDDEETVRAIGADMLRALGFAVVTAANGREALDAYRSEPDVAFVLLDLTMPHMDGEQCFRELRTLDPSVRVVMCSGYNEQEVTQRFVGKGLAGFLQKPYKLSELKDVLKRTLP